MEEKEYATAKDVRKILRKEFGSRNVSVRQGTGTSGLWIYAIVYIHKEVCVCRDSRMDNNRNWFICDGCKKEGEDYALATRKILELTKDLNFYTFSSDDGYGGELDCFNYLIRKGDYMQRKLSKLGK